MTFQYQVLLSCLDDDEDAVDTYRVDVKAGKAL